MSGRATHGHTRGAHGTKRTTPEFRSWCAMKARCLNVKSEKYKRYGGRGIRVCDRWLGPNGFTNFLADMGPKPTPKHTVDRFPDRNGNYEPGNCRWATADEQAKNRDKPERNRHSDKTHCPSGHPYAGDNLHLTPKGDRKCRECGKIRAAKARQAKRQGV